MISKLIIGDQFIILPLKKFILAYPQHFEMPEKLILINSKIITLITAYIY